MYFVASSAPILFKSLLNRRLPMKTGRREEIAEITLNPKPLNSKP